MQSASEKQVSYFIEPSSPPAPQISTLAQVHGTLWKALLACLPSHPPYLSPCLTEAVLIKYHNVLIGEVFVNLISSLTVGELVSASLVMFPTPWPVSAKDLVNSCEMPVGDVWASLTFL